MKKYSYYAIILVGLLLCMQGAVAYSTEQNKLPIQVSAELSGGCKKQGKHNTQVTFKVINISDKPIEFFVMSCSYEDHWRTDKKEIQIDRSHPCDKNTLSPIMLKPGEFYKDVLCLEILSTEPRGSCAIRLGFAPDLGLGDIIHHQRMPVYWSNQLDVRWE